MGEHKKITDAMVLGKYDMVATLSFIKQERVRQDPDTK